MCRRCECVVCVALLLTSLAAARLWKCIIDRLKIAEKESLNAKSNILAWILLHAFLMKIFTFFFNFSPILTVLIDSNERMIELNGEPLSLSRGIKFIGKNVIKAQLQNTQVQSKIVPYWPRRYIDHAGNVECILYGRMDCDRLIQVRGITLITGCDITTLDVGNETDLDDPDQYLGNLVVFRIVGIPEYVSKAKLMLSTKVMNKCFNVDQDLIDYLTTYHGDTIQQPQGVNIDTINANSTQNFNQVQIVTDSNFSSNQVQQSLPQQHSSRDPRLTQNTANFSSDNANPQNQMVSSDYSSKLEIIKNNKNTSSIPPPPPPEPQIVSPSLQQISPSSSSSKFIPIILNSDHDIENYDWQSNDKRTIIFVGTKSSDYNLPSIIKTSDHLKTPISNAFGPIKEIRIFADSSPKFATVTFQYNRSVQQCINSNQPITFKIENPDGLDCSDASCELQCFRYRIGDDESTREPRTIFIEKLDKSISKQQLTDYFGKFGSITMVRIFPDDCQGISEIMLEINRSDKLRSSRFAYITYARRGSVVGQVKIKSHYVKTENSKTKVNVEYYVYADSEFKTVMNPVLQFFSPVSKLNANDVFNNFSKVQHNKLFG